MIDLELKLKGESPVTREELFTLVSSWGRNGNFYNNDTTYIKEYEPNECYPLENLDISKIIDLSYVFKYSPYNGDLSKWNTSNVKYMIHTFVNSDFNNDSLKNWNTANVINMNYTFYKSKFNKDISKWDVSNVKFMMYMFSKAQFNGDISTWKFNSLKKITCILEDNKNFMKKYNDGNRIQIYSTESFLEWFEDNKKNISNLNISKKELNDIDDYLKEFNIDYEIIQK